MTTYSNEDKLKLFKNELEDIKSDGLRKYAEQLILHADDYFFVKPASTTGKYHPTLSLGEGGLVRHTRLVEWFAIKIATAMMIDERHTDYLIIAAIAHDMKKCGDGTTEYTVKEHPKLAAQMLENVWNEVAPIDGVEYADITKIQPIIESHMGQWGAEDGMPLPTTKMQLILHTADYLAARKEISEFNFRPTEDVEKIEEPCSEYRITFGKHKGKTLGQFYEENKDVAENYFEWVVNNEEFKIIEAKEKIKQFLNEKKNE